MAHIMDARMMINMRSSDLPSRSISQRKRTSTHVSTDMLSHPASCIDFKQDDNTPESDSANSSRQSRFSRLTFSSKTKEAPATYPSRVSRRSQNAGGNTLAMTRPNLIDLKTISSETVEWEGYLYKQRKLVKSWTPRYVTLHDNAIKVYKSKSHAIAKGPVRGSWLISQINSELPSTGFGAAKLQPDVCGFTIVATDGSQIHLIAWSPLVKAMWMHTVQLSVPQTDRVVTPRKKSYLSHLSGTHLFDTQIRQSLNSNELTAESTKSTESEQDSVLNRDNFSNASNKSSVSRAESAESNTLLAHRFFYKFVYLLSLREADQLTKRVPYIIRHLSKDVEFKFDLETTEATHPSCVFKGVYHGREGFLHFIALYQTKYLLDKDSKITPKHSRDRNNEIHSLHCASQTLLNVISGSQTKGTIRLRLTFTPARRISRILLSFCKADDVNAGSVDSASLSRASDSKKLRHRSQVSGDSKSVVANPMVIGEHPACFHQALLTKRSLALSFSDFDVVGVLGQGGFGTVVLVRLHHSPDELFAIKIIDKHSGAESALKERRILTGVRHPFLVCLRFAFQTQTKLYLGMDYYKGGNLYLHMHSTMQRDPNNAIGCGRRFTLEQARFYAAELAIALSYLHSCGIIYRDLKPDNVMLDKTGHIRLVDFGISKQLKLEGNNQYAPTGTLAGSPAYIAPEQLLTQRPQYGMNADWWSYGVLLYEMLTGTTPFADTNISSMYRKIQNAQVKYDRQPAMDPSAVDLLQKLLVRDPASRIGIEEIKSHPFFQSIDWERLETKDLDAPFIPANNELMENVHEHFKKMNVEKTLGQYEEVNKPGPITAGFFRRKQPKVDSNHFDEFSFCYDTNRESYMSVTMADDGWLMHQLREGAATRARLQHANSGDEPEIPSESHDEEHGDNLTSEDDAEGSKRTSLTSDEVVENRYSSEYS
uniref:Protein kinase putative n=1 Tax=Albugo laibachii Nc14 TaxID=890382 RepID=F0WM02_9STRA|nr:protein kinase putative [Albugo laibachii Nc14]|eukprot:CCA22329.1 protein kinase putative [Albugo laibachii Nc14]